ncbi:related to Protein RIC1 [Zygosaccharomyces bailii ISA1307]|nr:related to Protein RIC1 [Zygosaccharomyces bailii ISA1307]
MSRHMWPLQPPQRLRINNSIVELPGLNNNDILQTISLAQVNVLIMLTPGRVLVYNLKPLALVASHERTEESIAEFGPNKFVTQSQTLDEAVEGLISDKELETSAWHQGKIVFHVATEKNSLLTYQILKNCTNLTTFKEYGIPVVDVSRLQDDVEQEYDDSLDDDTLTVFEKDKSSKVIQNGYCVTKETGFLQFLSAAQDSSDELSLKKLELRLKVVLKFDYPVVDMIDFKRFSETSEGRTEEILLILFPHGLQLLTLVDFKLKDTHLVELLDGKRICLANGQVVVVLQNEVGTTTISQIEISRQKRDVTQLKICEPLLDCFEINGNVALVYSQTILYYDPVSNRVHYKWNVPIKIKMCNKLENDVLLVVTETGSIRFYTQFGNLLFSTTSDDEDENSKDNDYSDFICVDMMLLLTTHAGNYEIWNLWEELPQTFSDNRFPRFYTLHDSNNDIALYSPPNDSSSIQDILRTVKLPTNTINNCVPLVKVSPTSKLLAAYVSNKNVLLLQNLETNSWASFRDITILDMHWLGSTYLVCHIKQEDGSHAMHCFRFPLQDLETSEIEKYRIWNYEPSSSQQILSLHVNTGLRYRLLRVKARDGDELDKYDEKFYRTADIIIVTTDQIIVFAIISTINWFGLNLIKKFHEQMKVDISLGRKVSWVISHREGFMYLSRNTLIKLERENGWKSQVLLRDVERIIDLMGDELSIVQAQQVLTCKIEDLYDGQSAFLTTPIEEDFYPVSLTPETATMHGLHCIFQENYVKLIIKHKIYLDQMIKAKLAVGVSAETILMEYRNLKHFNFALEKILSTSLLTNEPLDSIIPLVKLCDRNMSVEGGHSDMLEIVSNCLRKTEAKHWGILFSKLKMTPKDLLARCLEDQDAKILGVLLLVFLNYDELDFMDDLRGNDAVADVIKNQEMMLRVLRLLVVSAANAANSTLAAESWDMCFQLIRLLKALDKENRTGLVQEAVKMLQPSST